MTENWASRCPDQPAWQRRILRNVSRADASGCWFWTALVEGRYGIFPYSQPGGTVARNTGAHRAAYLAFVGELADDMTLDHLCRNTLCVNPDHLEPVTQRVNTARASRDALPVPAVPRCVQGHPLSTVDAMCEDCPPSTEQPGRAKARRTAAPRRSRPLFISPTAPEGERLRDLMAAASRFKAS